MLRLDKDFFGNETLSVAKSLIGKIIDVDGVSGRIVEVEAYKQDEASHGFKRTLRSSIMYETYGYVYTYMNYGTCFCLNFTTEKDGVGAILIRALEPINNIEIMKNRRNTDDLFSLCSGPGKLCQALNIDKEFNYTPVNEKVKLYDDGFKPNIATSKRIGISKAKDLEWRFYQKDCKHVSKLAKSSK